MPRPLTTLPTKNPEPFKYAVCTENLTCESNSKENEEKRGRKPNPSDHGKRLSLYSSQHERDSILSVQYFRGTLNKIEVIEATYPSKHVATII
jgi:hypothetical protein